MIENLIKDLRLSTMDGKPTRSTRSLLFMDENCGPNNLDEYKLKRDKKEAQIVKAKNKVATEYFSKIDPADYHKYSDIKESRLPQPYRDYENFTDPTSHFLTAGHDSKRHLFQNRIKADPTTELTPQNTDPTTVNSDRFGCPNVFEEVDRREENDPYRMSYHGRYVSADACRANMAAKNELELIKQLEKKPKVVRSSFISNAFPEFTPKKGPNATEEELTALKFMYTSTTQKAAEEIPFDNYLHPRRWAPISTMECEADPVRAASLKERCYPPANSWMNGVDLKEFERSILRPDHFLQQRPYDFCSEKPRGLQIPSYSGQISSLNKDDIDNPHVKDFKPLTVVRSEVPKFKSFVERPVFVGYTGKVPYLPADFRPPHHTDPTPRNVLGQLA